MKKLKEIKSRGVPKEKAELVKKISEEMGASKTVLVASCKNLPSAQFHDIKKKFRGTAGIVFAKKGIISRAIVATEKGAMIELKNSISADFAIFLSDKDAFELSGMLGESQIPSKARAGDIAPEDIEIQPGPTDLVPGPAISELSGVGLKVAVKEGKLEIIKGAIVTKKGQVVKENVASVLGKLGMKPMKAGFVPVAAYDAVSDKVYTNIRIDKAGALENLREAIMKSLGLATSIKYFTAETARYFIAKAGLEEKALSRKIKT